MDYLLKPFRLDRFKKALEKVRARMRDPKAAQAVAQPSLPPRLARRGRPGADRRPRRAEDPHHSHFEAGLHRSPGRLRGDSQRQEELPEAADHRESGNAARSAEVRAHSPLAHRESGPHRAHRAVHARQPRRGAPRRYAVAGEPAWLRAAESAAGGEHLAPVTARRPPSDCWPRRTASSPSARRDTRGGRPGRPASWRVAISTESSAAAMAVFKVLRRSRVPSPSPRRRRCRRPRPQSKAPR